MAEKQRYNPLKIINSRKQTYNPPVLGELISNDKAHLQQNYKPNLEQAKNYKSRKYTYNPLVFRVFLANNKTNLEKKL